MNLEILGVSALEAAVLRALVTATSLTVEELSQVLDVPTVDLPAAVGALESRGLVVRRPDDPAQLVASRPSVALAGQLHSRSEQLRAAEATLADLEDRYASAQRGRQPADVFDVVLGAEAVAAQVEQIQLAAHQEVLSFVKAPVSVIGSSENTAEDVAVARGVRYRVVMERSMLDEERGLHDEIVRVRGLGEQVRLVPEVPIKLYIVDRQLALVPLGRAATPVAGALLVRRSGLLDALCALFDLIWAHGVDVGREPAPGANLAPADAHLLSLLLSGRTDEAIAGDLNVSVRTVQRRVRALMELAGAETRIQLGYAAARRGWAGEAADPAVGSVRR